MVSLKLQHEKKSRESKNIVLWYKRRRWEREREEEKGVFEGESFRSRLCRFLPSPLTQIDRLEEILEHELQPRSKQMVLNHVRPERLGSKMEKLLHRSSQLKRKIHLLGKKKWMDLKWSKESGCDWDDVE